MGEGVRRIGGYEIADQLGIGTMGTVYRARQLAMDRLVALKVLNPKYAQNPAYVARFVEEGKAAGRINHPNICQVYDVGEDKGLYYIAAELVPGLSLADLLRQRGKLSVPEAVSVVRQVALALGAAHRHGLIHKDVKPSNILIGQTGVAKLVDLGLAKDLTKPGEREAGPGGSASYMAPEISSGRPADIRSDIYALGATLYHAITGSPPFTGPHATAVMVKHASEPLTPPSAVDADISEAVSAVVERMLAKNPDDRYADPDELLRALDEAAAAGGPKAASEPGAGAPGVGRRRPARGRSSPRKSGSSPVVPAAIAAGAVLVGAVVIAVSVGHGSTHAEKKALIDLAEAERLVEEGSATSLQRATALAGEVIASGAASGSPEIRERAAKLRRRAEDGIVDAQVASLEKAAEDAMRGGGRLAWATRRIEEAERRYGDATIAPVHRERVRAVCARLRAELDAFEAARAAKRAAVGSTGAGRPEPASTTGRTRVKGPSGVGPAVTPEGDGGDRAVAAPVETPRATGRDPGASSPGTSESSVADVVMAQVRDLMLAGQFGDAILIIDMSMDSVGAVDRAVFEAAAKQVREGAAKAFSELLKEVSTLSRAGRHDDALDALESAKAHFGFDQYPKVIEAEIASVRAKAGN